jgi:hypothetical protein
LVERLNIWPIHSIERENLRNRHWKTIMQRYKTSHFLKKLKVKRHLLQLRKHMVKIEITQIENQSQRTNPWCSTMYHSSLQTRQSLVTTRLWTNSHPTLRIHWSSPRERKKVRVKLANGSLPITVNQCAQHPWQLTIRIWSPNSPLYSESSDYIGL